MLIDTALPVANGGAPVRSAYAVAASEYWSARGSGV